MLLMLMILMIILLSFLIMFMSTLISKKSFYDREKSSPFECGFDPKIHTRMPFSIHFFLITLIFVIFDLEITLILPLIKSMYFSNFFSWVLLMSSFLIILLIGLYYEWSYGALKWMN